MRMVIQRVQHARVTVEATVTGEIGPGLLVLLGITQDDTQQDIDWMVSKLIHLRIFSDDAGKMNLSVLDTGGSILVVSQFTLYADTRKGNRPSYIRSAPPNQAEPMYEQFVASLRTAFTGVVATGQFGAAMEVSLLNDGPVTILMDSKIPL
ncbi:MAG: D-aminoacyl-tRNA deacylase [Bacteroidia bacterium]|nr:D-aminoacyl-tRNA deacylase [Bacteroidia bacterium]